MTEEIKQATAQQLTEQIQAQGYQLICGSIQLTSTTENVNFLSAILLEMLKDKNFREYLKIVDKQEQLKQISYA